MAYQLFGNVGDQTLAGLDRPTAPILKLSANSPTSTTSRIQMGDPKILTGDSTVKQLDVNHADINTGKVLKVRTMPDGSQVICSADFIGGGSGRWA